jgi:ATP-dependent protease ClpP protease subunit
MAEQQKQPHTEKGFGLSIMDRIQNEGTIHHEAVRTVEDLTKRNLICYTAFLRHPASAIIQEDSQLIETLLRSLNLTQYPDTLDLLLHTPGGDPTAAERIVMTCRSYAKSFRVIVPQTAMSAGTLIAMGADSILMTETSEMGPIDPQMIITSGQEQMLRPAAAFVDAYLDLINKSQEAIKGGHPPHPYIELLRKVDPTWIQVCLKARELARTIAGEFLSRYMLKGKDKGTIDQTVERFMKEGELLSHGRIIRYTKAQEYGLNIDVIPKGTPLDNAVWELHVRCENYVQARGLAKYMVCRSGGLNVQVQRRAL